MSPGKALNEAVFGYEFTVPKSAVDQNGHVNNVVFVGWMQEAAVRHYEAMGGTEPTQALGATWVVRSHLVEYLRPAYAGEQLRVETWVVNMRRVRSLRRYRFLRAADGEVVARGETDWVFVDASSGAPRAVPPEVAGLFTLRPDDREP
jgi:acyl-CoA thioester hydrolase